MRTHVHAALAPILCLAAVLAAAAPAPPDSVRAPQASPGPSPTERSPRVFRMEELAEGVWAALVVERPDVYAFANSLVVLGEDGVLVVDTQQSPSAARALIDWIGERTDAPVRWVVNTHWHGDHVYGNQAYRRAFPDVRFVGHARLGGALAGPGAEMLSGERDRIPELVEERRRALAEGRGPDGEPLTDEERERLRYSLRVNEAQREELEDLELLGPDVEVSGVRALEVGGRVVRVMALERAHTGTDLLVHLPGAGIVAVGDLLEDGLPWVGEEADPAGWARALGRVAELEPSVILPAHGGVHRDRTLLEAQRSLFGALSRRVARAAARGMDLEATRKRVRLEDLRAGAFASVPDAAWSRWVSGAVERAWVRAREEDRRTRGSGGR